MGMIFLSYSRKDIDTMYRVKQRLTQAGLTVWTDENLTPGTSAWARKIDENLEICDAVVVLLSPAAYQSDWVDNECGKAKEYGKEVFPLLISGNPKDAVPLSLWNVQRIDLRRDLDGGLDRLVDVFTSRGWTRQPQQPAPQMQQPIKRQPVAQPKGFKYTPVNPLALPKTLSTEEERKEAETWFEKGNDFFYAKRYQEALAAYTRAIKLDPENGEYYDCRSDCYTELGDDDSALDDLVRGLEYG